MKRRKVIHEIQVVILLIVAAIVLVPYLWMITTSFKTSKDYLMNSASLWPSEWTLNGYIKVFTDSPIASWFLNSVIVTGSVTLIVLFTSSITGFVFAKYNFRHKEIWFGLILATMMVPTQVTMIPNFLIVLNLGLYNKLAALIVPQMVRMFGIFLCRSAIEDIPDSLCDAAKIDGASDFMIYWKIILPNLKATLSSLAIFTALAMWNDYLNPLIMLNDVENMTLPIAMNYFANQYVADMSATMAAATSMTVPMIILFLIFQKQFIKGSTLSGIK